MNTPNSVSKSVRRLGLALLLPLGWTAGASGEEKKATPPAAEAKVQVFDLAEVDQAPVASYKQRPRYPTDMRRAGIQGKAVIRFVVDSEGKVHDARVVEATHPDFGKAAATAVSGWKFKPGIKDGRPVNTRMQTPIMFTIKEES